MAKRGHSNVVDERGDRIEPWPDCPEKARIPIRGGASPSTCREFPPLALSREEWKEIGRKMGWLDDGK